MFSSKTSLLAALAACTVTALPTMARAASDTCLVGDHTGIADGDALTSARLVCDAVRALGRTVGPPTTEPPPGPAFRVQLQPLGRSLILTLAEEAPGGAVVTQRVLRLTDIEEVAVAAPRIAEAVVRRVPLEDTARVDNLVREETRDYEKKPGEFFWGAGVVTGAMLADRVDGALVGLDLRAFYETPRWSVGVDFRFAGYNSDQSDSTDAMQVALSVGGRYFFADGDFAPFAGGGLSMLSLQAPALAGPGTSDGNGAGLYAEAGVEVLRLRESRLSVDVRLDAPLYQLRKDEYSYDGYGSGEQRSDAAGYAVPLTVGVVYAW